MKAKELRAMEKRIRQVRKDVAKLNKRYAWLDAKQYKMIHAGTDDQRWDVYQEEMYNVWELLDSTRYLWPEGEKT